MRDLISPKTRLELREYFVGTSLSIITDAFRTAGIRCNESFDPGLSGERRTLVEQYYNTLDFSRWDDVRKVISVLEHVLDDLEVVESGNDLYRKPHATAAKERLLRTLRRDGFEWSAGRLLPPPDLISISNIHDAIAGLDAPELSRQLTRLRDSVNDDPSLAVGTAKEMLETACKTILEERGMTPNSSWDVGDLLKETRKSLKLLPDDIPSAAKGAQTIKRLLSNLGQLGVGLSELRNLYGSGHGRTGGKRGISPRHARLAVGSATTLIQFLFETHQEREQDPECPEGHS